MSQPPPPPGQPPGPGNPYAQPPGMPAQPGWSPAAPPTPPMMPPGGEPRAPKKKRTGCFVAALAVCGVFLMVSGSGLAWKMWDNSKQVIGNRGSYEPVMWKNERVDTLFPDSLAVRPGSQTARVDPERAAWQRLGISRKGTCDEGLSPELAEQAKKTGCEGVVRATYADPTGNMVATVALIIQGKDGEFGLSDYFRKNMDSETPDPYVRALPVPETVAADWGNDSRLGAAGDGWGYHYSIAVTTGAADGRKSGSWEGASEAVIDQRGPWNGAARNFVETYKNYLSDLFEKGDEG